MNLFYGGFAVFLIIFYLLLVVLGIYCTILFIKLAHRGIKALDIYINNNRLRNDIDNNQF